MMFSGFRWWGLRRGRCDAVIRGGGGGLRTSRLWRLRGAAVVLAVVAALASLPGSPIPAHAQTVNNAATGRPVVLVSAEDPGVFAVDVSGISDDDGFVNVGSKNAIGDNHAFSYRWIRVDGDTETTVGLDSPHHASTHFRQFHGLLKLPGPDMMLGTDDDVTPLSPDLMIESGRYRRVDADIGKLLKVEVSFTDKLGNSETVTSLPFGPVPAPAPLPVSTLVANTAQANSTTVTITGDYKMGFELGTHGQGYELSGVSIELAEAPSSLTVSLWMDRAIGSLRVGAETKLFDFENPSSLKAGLNRFTAPLGAFAYQKNVRYIIVLSGFGASLKIKGTDSDDEDEGGETGATLDNSVSEVTNVLRLAIEGSKRDSGILYSTYAQIPNPNPDPGESMDDLLQEIVSVGDKGKFGITVGSADRYLIRGVTLSGDNSSHGGTFTNPWQLRDGTNELFRMVNTRQMTGINEWTAPRGATVGGSVTYNLFWDISDPPDRMGGTVLSRLYGTHSTAADEPQAAGVTIDSAGANTIDIKLDAPYMAVFGEELVAMVQNLGQTNNSYASADSTNSVLSQGFTTGSDGFGYRLQGIGVEIEGSNSEFPDSPVAVAVAVHADAGGKPGAKLFDLFSPADLGAGHSFFEAPPNTHLAPDTSYVMVWNHIGGTAHRLERTTSNSEDTGAVSGAGIADALYRGADLSSLSVQGGGNSLSLAVYVEVNEDAPFVPGGVRVPQSWLHIPDGVEVGDQFRLVFVSNRGLVPDSGDIAVYNAFVQKEAEGTLVRGEEVDVPYTDPVIHRVAGRFKAVVCTAGVDAVDNTEMEGAIGVPVRWLDGGWDGEPTLIAENYADFYGDEWVNTEYGAYVTGNSAEFEEHAMVWTGCDSSGAAHPDYPMGSTMGIVAVGSPRDPAANAAPVGPVDPAAGMVYKQIDEGKVLPVYAISPVFTVVG